MKNVMQDAPKIRFLACPSVVKSISKKGVTNICCGDTHLGGEYPDELYWSLVNII